jgi:hypothetical protein
VRYRVSAGHRKCVWAAASGLQSQDDQNAAKIRAVSADFDRDQAKRPHNGILAVNHAVPLNPPPVLPEAG